MSTIAVVGGGASGMAAALSALENKKNTVTIYERQARLGKKLLSTGNGRCNLTNRNDLHGHYYGNEGFIYSVLDRYDTESILACFESIGLRTVTEESGRVYPVSDNASSVLDCLRFALQEKGCRIVTDEIQSIKGSEGNFVLKGLAGNYKADKVIVACGGCAGGKVGGVRFGYELLESLGHKRGKLYPSLVQLKTDNTWTKSLKGIRTKAAVKLKQDASVIAENYGEIQFTDYGVSGPVIFDISRRVSCSEGKRSLSIDFFPDMGKEELFQYMKQKTESWPGVKAENLFTGALHNSLSRILVRRCEVGAETLLGQIGEKKLRELSTMAKCYMLEILSPLGFDSAQVTAGGILTGDFDARTMESRLVRGLYACGEELDVDGDCGGYNLQWAWASGRLAGLSAGGVK